MCNRTQNDAIWGLIALFLTNQIAGNTIDFKMNAINCVSFDSPTKKTFYFGAFRGMISNKFKIQIYKAANLL